MFNLKKIDNKNPNISILKEDSLYNKENIKKRNTMGGRSKPPSGAEWDQFSLQLVVNTSKLFAKNLKAPSAQGAVTSSNKKKTYKIWYKKCQIMKDGGDNLRYVGQRLTGEDDWRIGTD